MFHVADYNIIVIFFFSNYKGKDETVSSSLQMSHFPSPFDICPILCRNDVTWCVCDFPKHENKWLVVSC